MRRDSIHDACGNPFDLALDPEQPWLVDDTLVCQACATKAMVERQKLKAHEDTSDVLGKPRYEDGRLVSVRPATEADLRAAKKGSLATATRG